MRTSWRRVAAAVLCAACAAVETQGAAAREPIAGGGPYTPAGIVVVHLRMPALAMPVVQAPQPVWSSVTAPRATRHVIAPGDTMWVLAASVGIRVHALAAANGLSETSLLTIGRVLTIPAPGTPAPVRAATPRAAAPRAVAPHAAAAPPSAPSPATGAPTPSGVAGRLALLWPSGGIVTSRFGWRIHPIFGSREFHTGMDIATRYGSPVVAALGGVVRFVGWKSGYGRLVVIEHDGGIQTSYSHLSAAVVSPGQGVAPGQVIGRIGSSGWSTGPHLFFEVRRNGVPIDPAHYLN